VSGLARWLHPVDRRAIAAGARFLARLPSFLRNPLSLDDARHIRVGQAGAQPLYEMLAAGLVPNQAGLPSNTVSKSPLRPVLIPFGPVSAAVPGQLDLKPAVSKPPNTAPAPR